MPLWWSLLEPLFWCPIFKPSHYNLWRSGNRRFHLREPDLQTSSRDLTTWKGTRIEAPAISAGRHARWWLWFELFPMLLSGLERPHTYIPCNTQNATICIAIPLSISKDVIWHTKVVRNNSYQEIFRRKQVWFSDQSYACFMRTKFGYTYICEVNDENILLCFLKLE